MPNGIRRGAAAGGIALILAAVQARGELLYFREGGRVQAPAVLEGGRVCVVTPFGRYDFPEAAFSNIVPGHDPERDWESRKSKALAGDAEARLRAAWWALRNGLIDGSVELIRASRETPSRDPMISSLNSILDQLEAPRGDRDDGKFREALGISLETLSGKLVTLLHQETEPEASARLAHLERVVRAYYLWFGFHGMSLSPPANRLIFVQVAERSDYERFLTQQNAGALINTQGYFHPTFRVVLACDAPKTTAARPSDGPQARRQFLKACEREAIRLGIASHELVHLLVVESGLDPDSTRFPLWLHEGLAAQFEVVRGGRWAGIGLAHDIRLNDWRTAPAPPPLSGVLLDRGFGQGYRKTVYAASWALVNYLSVARPKEFVAYLDALRVPDVGVDRVARSEVLFRKVFGQDLTVLESEWQSYMIQLKTPLELCDPTDRPQNPPRRD